jgi:hypothetical protein
MIGVVFKNDYFSFIGPSESKGTLKNKCIHSEFYIIPLLS